jgi:hypothetical protein
MPLIDPETGSQMVLFVVLLDVRLTAQQDPSLMDWLLNAKESAGDFLRSLADAGLRADTTSPIGISCASVSGNELARIIADGRLAV